MLRCCSLLLLLLLRVHVLCVRGVHVPPA
jgi:hypothetical protein